MNKRALIGLEIHNKSDVETVIRNLNKHIRRDKRENTCKCCCISTDDETRPISVKNVYVFNFSTWDIEKLPIVDCFENDIDGLDIESNNIKKDGSVDMSMTGSSYRRRYLTYEYCCPVIYSNKVIQPREKYSSGYDVSYGLLGLDISIPESIYRFKFRLIIDLDTMKFEASHRGFNLDINEHMAKLGVFYSRDTRLYYNDSSFISELEYLPALNVLDSLILYCFCKDDRDVTAIIPDNIKYLLFDVFYEKSSFDYNLIIPNSLESLRILDFDYSDTKDCNIVLYFSKVGSYPLLKSLTDSLLSRICGKHNITDTESAISLLNELGFKVKFYG